MGVPGDAPAELPAGRASDDAIWVSISATLRNVVLPALSDPFARAQTIQLIALAEHAHRRGDDPTARRTAELEAVLDALQANPLVSEHWPGDPAAAAAAALVAAVGRDDDAANAVRALIRPVLVRHLDEDLASTTQFIEAFRGRLPA